MDASTLKKRGRVLLLNSSEDVVEALKQVLLDQGHEPFAEYLRDLRTGKRTFEEAFACQPDVILFDLAPPFEVNFDFLQVLRRHPLMAGRKLIVTTTNWRAVHQFAGDEVLELLLKPDDLDRLSRAISRELGLPEPLGASVHPRRDQLQ